MEIIYSEKALEDISYWKKSGNKGDKLSYSIEKRKTQIVVHSLKGHYDL